MEKRFFDNFINSKIQKKWFKEIVLQQKQFSRSNNRKKLISGGKCITI